MNNFFFDFFIQKVKANHKQTRMELFKSKLD